MQDELKRFANAITAGAGVQAPTSSIPEMEAFYRPDFMAGATSGIAKGMGAIAGDQAAREEAAAKEAHAQKKAEMADMMDPGKYKRLRKGDGGFAFFDPTGNQIDIDTYAKRTGIRRTDAIKDSENPLDTQFEGDWQAANELAQAVYRNDKGTIGEYAATFPDLFSRGTPKPDDINRMLLEKYPHMYGMGQYERSLRNLGEPVFRMGRREESGSGGKGRFTRGG